MAKARKRRKNKKSKSTGKPSSAPKVFKDKLNKSQFTKHLINYVESQEEEITSHISTRDMKKLVTSVMNGFTDAIERSISPGSVGEFMLPRMFKITLRTKKAVRKGTLVRSPATGEMVPSKGRPASKQVKIRPLANLKRAATGE